jgi:PTS system nitrogen regulatory IIA component
MPDPIPLEPRNVTILQSDRKAGALDELAGLLVANGLPVGVEVLAEALAKREKLMSTGIGHGIAVPHVRLPGVKAVHVAVGICREGLADYESLDPEPIRVVVMIVAPQGRHDEYVRVLAAVVSVLKEPDARRRLVDAADPGEAYRLLVGRD